MAAFSKYRKKQDAKAFFSDMFAFTKDGKANAGYIVSVIFWLTIGAAFGWLAMPGLAEWVQSFF